MAAFLKPDNLNIVWASGGDRLYPGDTKYASGWGVEIPPRQYFNEIDYKQDQMLAHINQRGIAEWDANTEYQADKSYTQDSTGTIYRCILTHSGRSPELDVSNTYWEIAFANAGDFYTKLESDAAFITPAELSAYSYSKSETYTQTEVNAKTTVASAAQSQALTGNTTLITPLRLNDAFKGVNQNLTALKGHQKLPGGLILQWGSLNTSAAEDEAVTFDIPFTNVFSITATADSTGRASNLYIVGQVLSLTLTGFNARASLNGDGNALGERVSSTLRWIAIGTYV